ncbi:MAG: ABC transporter ATP-binding protein [Desulfobacterales bacterium]|nr:MAG: ABC transporter ATP-binding protein [Desulfobacterales bacterium]
MLEINRLHAGYGRIKVLRNVSLQVDASEIICIIGPNGAGKSTVLRSISGILNPMSGTIKFLGQDIGGRRPDEVVKSGICFVPQGRSVFPSLTVEENLEMGAFIRDDKAEVKKDIAEIYQRFPILAERRKQNAATLSGGEQQLLVIGRALILHPKLLLLDEPTLGLAPMFRQMIFEKIMEINREGTPVILVEQNAYGALQISHRGYVLELGRNKMTDSGQNLLENQDVVRLYMGG